MTTAKQRAAARRNIKKAQAALRRKKHRHKGHKKNAEYCARTAKALANHLREKGYVVRKK